MKRLTSIIWAPFLVLAMGGCVLAPQAPIVSRDTRDTFEPKLEEVLQNPDRAKRIEGLRELKKRYPRTKEQGTLAPHLIRELEQGDASQDGEELLSLYRLLSHTPGSDRVWSRLSELVAEESNPELRRLVLMDMIRAAGISSRKVENPRALTAAQLERFSPFRRHIFLETATESCRAWDVKTLTLTLGHDRLAEGHRAEAAKCFLQVLQQWPDPPGVLRVVSLAVNWRVSVAVQVMDHFLRLGREHLVISLKRLQEFAAQYAQRTVRRTRQRMAAQPLLLMNSEFEASFRELQQELENILQYAPEEGGVAVELARVHALFGETDRGIAVLEDVLKHGPLNDEEQLHVSHALVLLADFEERELPTEAFHQALERGPATSGVSVFLSIELAFREGDCDLVSKTALSSLHVLHFEVLNRMRLMKADCAARRGELKEAFGHLEKADIQFADIAFAMGLVAAHLGAGEAIAESERVLKELGDRRLKRVRAQVKHPEKSLPSLFEPQYLFPMLYTGEILDIPGHEHVANPRAAERELKFPPPGIDLKDAISPPREEGYDQPL